MEDYRSIIELCVLFFNPITLLNSIDSSNYKVLYLVSATILSLNDESFASVF